MRSRLLNKKNYYCSLVFMLVLLIYIFTAGKFSFRFTTDPSNYFSHLSYSFLEGKLYLINPIITSDLSLYKNHLYMYWGPTPTLLILPLVFLFGVNISDALYTAFFGSISSIFVFLILYELNLLKVSKNSLIKLFLLTLFFSLGTVHFYLSARGGVWFTSQIISTLYANIAIFFLLKYLKISNYFNLILTALFINLAVLGRISFIFYLPFFLCLIVYINFHPKKQINLVYKHISLFLLLTLLSGLIYGLYNYLRFDSFLESGHSFHNVATEFAYDKEHYGTFNVVYALRNFYFMFLSIPEIINKYPFFNFNPHGNSIFFTSSTFFLLFLLFQKKFWKEKFLVVFNLSALISIAVVVTFLLFYFSTGWIQLGYRYLLDAIPLMMLLLGEVVSTTSTKILTILILLSIIITFLGTSWMVFQ